MTDYVLAGSKREFLLAEKYSFGVVDFEDTRLVMGNDCSEILLRSVPNPVLFETLPTLARVADNNFNLEVLVRLANFSSRPRT